MSLEDTVYSHLRAIAQAQMNAERPGHTLTATALVHEAYLRLDGDERAKADDRAGFLRVAAEAMRRILIEHARGKARLKRGGGKQKLSLDSIGDVADLARMDEDRSDGIVAFDDAFRRLEVHDPEVGDVVRLRFFAGRSVAETAVALGVSERTINNRWAYARAWLAREIERETESGDGERR